MQHQGTEMQDQFMALIAAICAPGNSLEGPPLPQIETTRKRPRDDFDDDIYIPTKKHKPMPLRYVLIIPDFEYLRHYSSELLALQARSVRESEYRYKLFVPEPVYEELLAQSDKQSESCKQALWDLSLYYRLCKTYNASTHSVYRIWKHQQTKYSREAFLACIKEIAPKFDQCDILVLTTRVDRISPHFGDPRIFVCDRLQVSVRMQ